MIHMPATFTCSVGAAANDRHSAYSLRFATIAYPWHPLAGRTLQVSPFRRGRDLKCIYTDERPDLCRELPNWMFDASYCAGMTLGTPEISIEGLNQLSSVLAALGKTRRQDARSRSLEKKENGSAQEPVSVSNAACSRAEAIDSRASSGARDDRIGRNIGRPPAAGPGCRRAAGEGRRG